MQTTFPAAPIPKDWRKRNKQYRLTVNWQASIYFPIPHQSGAQFASVRSHSKEQWYRAGVFFSSPPRPRPRTYRRDRRGYYFYSPQSSTFIKSKMAATTILQTRTRFRPPKIRLHCRLTICKQKNTFAVITYVHYAKWTLFPDKLPNFPSFFSWSRNTRRNTHACYLSICSQHLTFF